MDQLPGVNVVHLRAAFFMENLESSIGLIKTQGIIGTPLKGDLKLPVIATRDIALICGSSFVICILGGVLPAIRAGRLKPVEALRYE